jgi:hypothetical protein
MLNEYLLEPFMAQYFLIDAVCRSYMSEDDRIKVYNELARVFCLDCEETEALYNESRKAHFDSITDLSSLAGIPNLQSLTLSRNELLTDVSPLVNCPNLAYLYLELCTGVKDISALSSSTTLKRINIDGIEGLNTSAFDGTEIEIQKYY